VRAGGRREPPKQSGYPSRGAMKRVKVAEQSRNIIALKPRAPEGPGVASPAPALDLPLHAHLGIASQDFALRACSTGSIGRGHNRHRCLHEQCDQPSSATRRARYVHDRATAAEFCPEAEPMRHDTGPCGGRGRFEPSQACHMWRNNARSALRSQPSGESRLRRHASGARHGKSSSALRPSRRDDRSDPRRDRPR
jgi:hypothetical protein